jgi:hypothetical protein
MVEKGALRHVIDGATEGARHGYQTTRSELGELVPPHVVDAALTAWRTEGRRMAATARAVGTSGAGLRGEVFKPYAPVPGRQIMNPPLARFGCRAVYP